MLLDPPPERGRVWRAAADFERGEIRAVLTGAERDELVVCDLDGRNVRARAAKVYGDTSSGAPRLRLPYGDEVGVPLPGAIRGFDRDACVLAPDRRSVAFLRNEHEVWHWRLDEKGPRCLVRARGGTELNARWGWGTAPSFSPDGRLLWFGATTSKRWATPRNPDFVARMRASGDDPRMVADAIEHNHWRMKHRVGIVDLASGDIWMRRGHWGDVAWAPLRE